MTQITTGTELVSSWSQHSFNQDFDVYREKALDPQDYLAPFGMNFTEFSLLVSYLKLEL